MRLKSGIWVRALIRRCAVAGVAAVVARHGDETAGTVLVRVSTLDGYCRIYAPRTSMTGERHWFCATGAEPVTDAHADAYAERQFARDPDLWVVEIEDRQGRHFLTEPTSRPQEGV